MSLRPDVLRKIDLEVRGGFCEPRRIVEIVCDYFELGEEERVQDELRVAVRGALRAHRESAANWPETTDCDRLDRAFVALDGKGVIALQNAGFTQSDGHEDVRDAFDSEPDKKRISGYCFFNGQDLEAVLKGKGLHLAFGPIDPKRERNEGLRIGETIVDCLSREGLSCDWDGSFDHRILVPKFNWQRRRDMATQMVPLIRQVFVSSQNLCASFKVDDNDRAWLQITKRCINFSYPHKQHPRQTIAAILAASDLRVDSWKPGTYATAEIKPTDPRATAKAASAILSNLFDAEGDSLNSEMLRLRD